MSAQVRYHPVSDQERAAPAEKWQRMDVSETSLTPTSTALATSPTGQRQSKKYAGKEKKRRKQALPSPRRQLEQQLIDAQYRDGGHNGHGTQQQQQQQQQQPSLTARFIPEKGIPYLPQANKANNDSLPCIRATSQASVPSPLSPTMGRPIQPQQGNFYPQQMQRPSSGAPVPNLNDLGKGVPLSSVPASWPLYIVKFKADRTVLFYLTYLTLHIREDRGKNSGTVVNDSITPNEVEAFECEQRERVAYGDGGPLSPGSQLGSKKEINPKMINGKAQPQDRQYSFISQLHTEAHRLPRARARVVQFTFARRLVRKVIQNPYLDDFSPGPRWLQNVIGQPFPKTEDKSEIKIVNLDDVRSVLRQEIQFFYTIAHFTLPFSPPLYVLPLWTWSVIELCEGHVSVNGKRYSMSGSKVVGYITCMSAYQYKCGVRI
ncbi:hypothetical protein F5141DRAFT_1205893 [Pisolithus sp. B1]|nr:hypothetical protein F5141DRAFT_1205893 [Pisolithus sp. B1]